MSLALRASSLLERRLPRRRFLTRTALVGTALVVDPARFLLRPGTAYAAVCGCAGRSCACGSPCCDGYTEFCCTLSGRNECPPGTLLGGWWKVDGSSYCGGAARYYLDCNAGCGDCGCGASGICAGSCSGTPCGCAGGDCANRKRGCTGFRYGQCHNEVACLGPIVCRVVSCTPPWELDPACTTAARTDNNTRYHHAACLAGPPPGSPVGHLDEVVFERGGGVRVRGWAVDPDTSDPVSVHVYVGEAGTDTGPAERPRPDVGAAYPSAGPDHGFDTVVPTGAAAGPTRVCVYAVNAGAGANVELGCVTVDIPTAPFGFLEAVTREPGGVRVRGWVVDPDSPEPVRVHVYAGGVATDIGAAATPRPDVAASYPDAGPDHGFDTVVSLPAAVPAGVVDVCAYGINVGPGRNAALGCRQVEIRHDPIGRLDAADDLGGGVVRVRGWALDPDSADPVEVHVYVDGVGHALGPAAAPRPDVAAAHPGYGPNHGFDAVLSVDRAAGRRVCAYALDTGGGPNTLLGCRVLG